MSNVNHHMEKAVRSNYGLTIGGDIMSLGQSASEGPGETDAAGSVARLYGTWTLLGRGTSDNLAKSKKLKSPLRTNGYGRRF